MRAAVSRRRTAAPFANAPAYVIALALGAVVVVPIVYVAMSGFRTTGQLAADPVSLPHPWVTHNYTNVITSGAFWRQLGNSAIIAAIATALIVGVSSLAAYPLSRFEFRGREAIYTFFTFGFLFPIAVAALPLYLLLRQLGLDDTVLGVALPEAAGFFWRVLLPLSRPALMTVVILQVIYSWNNFILPLLVLTDPNHWTLPLGAANYSTEHSADTAGVLAFTTLSMIPALVFFLLAERRIVGGFSGAVKG
jgi:raffinose/stachyose/melibiose transport system permease protein